MNHIYHYSVVYIDDFGRKHLRFCRELEEVKNLRYRYKVEEVNITKFNISDK